MSFRSLALSSLLAVALPGTAFAGAEIRARITDLRVQPSDQAKARMKLGAGREVAVLGKSDDGLWVKVAGSLERGEDVIRFEGWVTASDLTGDFGDAVVAASSPSSSGGSADWGDGGSDSFDAPASSSSSGDSGDWSFDDTSSASSSAPQGDNSWDTASASSSSSSEDTDWGDGGSDSDSSSDDSGDDWGGFE